MKYLMLSLVAGPLLAAGWLETPRQGCVHDPGSGVRMVYGLRSNFVLGAPEWSGAVAAACSQRWLVVKTETALMAVDERGVILSAVEASGGGAVLGFGEREAAYAFLAESRRLWRWSGGEWEPVAFREHGEVLAVSGTSDSVAALVRRDGGVWLVKTRDGAVVHEELVSAEVTAALLWTDGAMLLAEGATLRMRDPRGLERLHEVPGPVQSVAAMGQAWVRVELNGLRLALERGADGERIHVLPGGAR
jgi:hypothetical protein